MSSNRGHRAGQCAPEVPRTRIRARGDLQERRTRPSYSHIQHTTPAPRSGDKPHPAPNTCVPGQAAASSPIGYLRPRPGDSLIRRRYRGGVGNRCRWAERFAMSEQWLQGGSNGDGRIYLNKCRKVRIPQLRVSKSGPDAPEC